MLSPGAEATGPMESRYIKNESKAPLFNDLRETGLIEEVKASGLPAPVMTYLNREDKASRDRPKSNYGHRVATLALRSKVSKFNSLCSGCLVANPWNHFTRSTSA